MPFCCSSLSCATAAVTVAADQLRQGPALQQVPQQGMCVVVPSAGVVAHLTHQLLNRRHLRLTERHGAAARPVHLLGPPHGISACRGRALLLLPHLLKSLCTRTCVGV